ncbi:uncharacterized protein [Amphiura filiformis]|uniref:uncharacterized protein isoform X2 n=1 Tax=Amphiura filiformis TaxID=82378 RepID=UPI003B215BF9
MKMRDDRDDSNGGKVKRFAYASSKANKETSAEEWDLFGPKKKQSDGLGGLDDLDDVWSIRKNVSLSNGLKTNNTSTKPPVNPSLTSNTGFYSRHGQYNGKNSMLSPSTSPSDFPRSSGSVWNQPRGGGYSYSQQEGNSSHDFNDSSSPRGLQPSGRTANASSGGLQPPGRTATHGNTRNMQMGGVYPRSPKPDRHHTQHNAKGRPNNNWPNY